MFKLSKYDKNGFDENGYNKFGFDKFGYNKQGFDKDGYDKRGFNMAGFHKLTGLNKDGFDKDGYDKTGFNSDGYDRDGYDHSGYNKNGYDRNGYNMLGFDPDGFDIDGYNIEGFDKQGFNRDGYNKDGYDINGFDRDGYDKNGYDMQGFNRQGYNDAGFDAYGFDINGYDKDGYDIDGFSHEGYDRNGYDHNGYDVNGFNTDGFNSDGYDRDGYNVDGYNKDGYNRDGYDSDGYNKDGFDEDGFNRQGYDNKGYNREGYDSEGYNRTGFDKNGYNKEGFDKNGFTIDGYDIDGFNLLGRDCEDYGLTGYNREGFNREGFNQDGFHKDDFDENGYNKYTGLNSEGYDREGYNVNGLNIDGFDKDGFNIDGIDKDGYDREGYNEYGYNRTGYDREGYNHAGFNELGFDRSGYNKDGYDKNGYNRLGFNKEGYDKNGLNSNGKRKARITSLKQIQHGLRIKKKKTGERGRIISCDKKTVYFTYDNLSGTGISVNAPIDVFMDLFFIDDDGKGIEYEREALYHNKVRQFLFSQYYESVLIPKERSKVIVKEKTCIDKNGFLVTVKDGYDEDKVRFKAEVEAKRLAETSYFAHIDYLGNPDLYIGKEAIPGYVVDWADKRAAYYYDYKIYIADRKLGIRFVRDITLKKGEFSDFHDLYNYIGSAFFGSGKKHTNIADEKLLEIINRNRTSKSIHDIVESIQTKQYEIITQDANKGYLVNGCAGSGKTMILLHRIRYILFNNQDIKADDLIVVSPTDILGRESKELAKILNVEKTTQYSTAEFYKDIIKDILDSNGMFHRIEEFQICDSDDNAETNDFNSCMDIINGNLIQKSIYVNSVQKILLEEKRQITLVLGEEYLLNGNPYYLSALRELDNCSRNDISNIIKYIIDKVNDRLPVEKNRKEALTWLLKYLRKGVSTKNEYDEVKIRRRFQRVLDHVDRFDCAYMGPVNMETKHPITRFVQAISLLSGETDEKEILQMINDIKSLTYGEVEHMVYLVNEEITQLNNLDKIRLALENTIDIIDYNGEDSITIVTPQEIIDRFENLLIFIQTTDNICETLNVNPFVVFRTYNDIEKELKILNESNSSNNYVFDMLLRKMNILRDRQNQKIVINKQQLQNIFHILMEKFCKPNNRRFYIFLDEFQDYTPQELVDIQKYYNNAVINLYGDVNQCINENGVNNLETLQGIINFDGEYELKENYRNSSEITAYVNKRFEMDMYKIGLKGCVKESKQLCLGGLEDGDRGAIIISDESIINKLRLDDYKDKICYYNEKRAIHKNCYNVITVAQAKGLEFEKVIVIDMNMTKNKLYVACTRAIRDLDIVNLS